MSQLRVWFCHNRKQLLRWSLLLAAASPAAAVIMSRALAVDAGTVLVAVAAVLFAVWRPYRDSWLRQACERPPACVSH